jgi:hypothetical protein
MSKEQVKIEIDGNLINIEDFLSDTNKTYYAEPIKDGEIEGLRPIAEVVKKQILTDIRDYLVERQRCLVIESRMCPKIRETALVLSMIEDLQKYAEKLGVEL